MRRDVSVAIPAIPSRPALLQRAVRSVQDQTQPASGISVAFDLERRGGALTRNRAALGARESSWIAFLDDDDEFYPGHLKHLLDLAEDNQADVTWAWFEVIGGHDPFPHYRGRQYDISNPHIVPITYLVRTDLWMECYLEMGGFIPQENGAGGVWDVQDQPLMDAYVKHGARLHASNHSSWKWHHHAENTSGMQDRW